MGVVTQVDLQPVSVRASPVRRLAQLAGGLALYGASMGLMVRGTLGLDPWDVLHDAIAERTGLTFGTVTGIVGALVLLCWIPLRQRPGIGTVANIVLIAVAVDLTLAVVEPPSAMAARIAMLLGGVLLNGLATATYLGVRLGPGPRDGLMTGLAARTGISIRVMRTGIELTVLATGWLLGGTVGVGTVVYALCIGPLTQAFLPYVTWRRVAVRER
ncbi:membrane protein YczE [Actinophytocola sediminis]